MRRGDDELKRQVDSAIAGLLADGTVARVLATLPRAESPPVPRAGSRISCECGGDHPSRTDRPGPRARYAEGSDVQKSLYGSGQDSLGRRAGGGPRPEQPPVLDGAPVAGRARLRDRRPARRAARRLAAGLLGVFRTRLLSLEAGGQAALRRDPGRHARRSIRAAGPLFTPVLCRRVPNGRPIGRRSAFRPGRRWPSRKGSRCADSKGVRSSRYPSTEAILEAVATGREKAGYVISTRGPWLAHERWPGKLEFLPAASDTTVDCVSHQRGGAQVGPRAEGRDRSGLGGARSVGPAGQGLRPLAHPLRAGRGSRVE